MTPHTHTLPRNALKRRALALIADAERALQNDAIGPLQNIYERRDALLTDMACYQHAHLPAFAKLQPRGVSRAAPDLSMPALETRAPGYWRPVPTDVFRFTRIACFPRSAETRCFVSSGTTQSDRSKHPQQDMDLYLASTLASARYALFPDDVPLHKVILAPRPSQAPHSSLAFMLDAWATHFEGPVTYVWEDEQLNDKRLRDVLTHAQKGGEPLALLGTSFAFIHALDTLGPSRWTLPTGSRLMHTGGTKGRSRDVDPKILKHTLASTFGLETPAVVEEYGMTELSSQSYQLGVRHQWQQDGQPEAPSPVPTHHAGRFWIPPWVRASVVDVESGAPLPHGTPGLLRIDDPANLDSVSMILTGDRARIRDHQLELCGRTPQATPRGCSLDADIQLSARSENAHRQRLPSNPS